MLLITAFLFSLSSNIDNLIIGVSYGIKDEKIPIFQNTIIAIITTVGTLVAMIAGKLIEKYISNEIGNILGAAVIILMGLYFILVSVKEIKGKKKTTENFHEQVAVQKNIGIKDSIVLGFALATNNLGVGVAASIMGLSIFWVCIFTFITSILTILIGEEVGDHIIGRILGKYDNLISGILLIILGLIEIF
ncbi:MAG: manganese efflux pump [Clostridium sp.]